MDEIQPALSAEEWTKWEFEDGSIDREHGKSRIWFDEIMWTEKLHGLAAFCLWGQPFGFTWEDVDQHHQLAAFEGSIYGGKRAGWKERQAWHLSMANRIAALLPPRGSLQPPP